MDLEVFKQIEPGLPDSPGVYKFHDKHGALLYVGKAKNLKKRVASYFQKQKYITGKTRLLVNSIADIQYTLVNTEQDALLLENTLIKKHQPRYNIQLKDDKSFPFICIKKERFPRVFLTRTLVPDGSEYLGPYTSVKKVRKILNFIKTLFPLRTCTYNLSQKNIEAGKFKLCLEYHIGNCRGPCESLETEEDYGESIRQIRNILKGNTHKVIRELKGRMDTYAKAYQFEQANDIKEKLAILENYQSKSTVVNAAFKNIDVFTIDDGEKRAYVNHLKIQNGAVTQDKTMELSKKLGEAKEEALGFAINAIRQEQAEPAPEIILPFPIELPFDQVRLTVPRIGDKKLLLALSRKNLNYYKSRKMANVPATNRNYQILEQLQKDLVLNQLPEHIECFDNSNFQGDFPVASMVVFRQGKPSKKDYRHFNIKSVEGPDDFGSMREIVFRRYRRLLEEAESLPQLILIDGGKGQLSAAVESLVELNIIDKVQVIAIAKKLEELYRPSDPDPLHISKKSSSLKLLQQLRNEAHRFAITFHRSKRSKATIGSELAAIPGIGQKTQDLLLKRFRSVKKIREATEEELTAVIGKHKAAVVHNYYNNKRPDPN